MKAIWLITTLILPIFIYGQTYSGIWKGSMYLNGTAPEKGQVIYLELNEDKSREITGKSRNELYDTDNFALKNIKGKKENGSISLNEVVITKKTNNSKTRWCRLQMELAYNEKTGYLEGNYTSNECRNTIGKLILYKTTDPFPNEEKNQESHHWFELLSQDLKKGLKAPDIRKKERENFVFKPIYFDYDKSDIKPEFYEFLNEMIHVVEGHTDLRVKVTGNTDSDGSDVYNDGLSQRRAQAIIDYFISKGLDADRLEFDFKGEKNPVDTNKTAEGRQKNRRVDFQFI